VYRDLKSIIDTAREEGKIEGRIKGKIEVKIEGKIEVAVKMVKNGEDDRTIASYMELTVEEIGRLRKGGRWG